MSEIIFTEEGIEISRRDKEVLIHAPYFNKDLEAVKRVIRFRSGERASLVVEENGKPVCGMSGQIAKDKLKQFLLNNIF